MIDDAMWAAAFESPIHTPRFAVRRVDERDLGDLFVVNGDDEVTAYLPYETWRSMTDAAAWLERMRAREADGDTRQLVVVDRLDDHAIGAVLLFKVERASARAELGYVLGRDLWGRGVMREALPVVIAHAFDAIGLRRLEAVVDADNAASHRLLLKLGFLHEGTQRARDFMKGRLRDARLYGVLRDEWTGRATR